MDLLGNIFVPETLTDLFIVKFGLFLSLILLLPYLSVLIGAQLFSLIHFSKAKIYQKSEYLAFAKYLTETITKRMWVRITFGVLPFLGVSFFYSQLYPNSSENMLFAFILFVVGICLSVAYKGSFKIKEVDDAINSEKIDVAKLSESKANVLQKGGWFGLFLLYVSSFIVITYLQAAITPTVNHSNSILGIMFSTSTIIYFLLFVTITFSITSAVIVARMNRTNQTYAFKSYSREFAIKTGILFAFVQPILFVLNVFSVASAALSFSFFITSLFVLLLMLVISVQFYINYRSNRIKGTSIVFVFLLLFTFLIYNAQMTSEIVDKKEALKKGNVLEIFS